MLLSLLAGAQPSAGLRISEVKFSGLQKSKAEYLARFTETKKDAFLDEKTLEKDEQALKNLYSVADAKAVADTVANGIVVTFEITEALTFFPLLDFGRVKGNLWYQAGFTDVNFLGKGNQITVFYRNNDKRHNVGFYYRIPYLRGSRWGGSVNFLRWASVEPVFFPTGTPTYDYSFTNGGFSAVYEIKNNHTVEAGANFFTEYYRKIPDETMPSSPGPDELTLPKLLFKFTHLFRKIDYHNYFADGWDNIAVTESVRDLAEGNWFHVFRNDLRYFKRTGQRGNLALRVRIGISTNKNTPFAPFVLDSQTNIRGAGNRRDRGTGALVLNTEYRYAFFDIGGRFAAQAVVFSDVGTWRSPGGSLSEFADPDIVRFFCGGGLRLIYKKAHNAVLRVDYGIDLLRKNERGWVLGAGQYF